MQGRYRIRGTLLASAIAALAICAPAFAQQPEKENGVAKVPGGDIFGFTEQTDIGSPGDHSGAIEVDGAFGKRQGRYQALTQKYGYDRTVGEGWALGVALFSAHHRIRNVPVAPINRTSTQFDGASFAIKRGIFKRSGNQPFGLTVALEPRWARLDDGGRHAESFGAELKFFLDTVVVPDRLFWAGNLVLGYDNGRDPDIKSKWAKSSEVKVTQALALQVAENFFVGMEATYAASFSGAGFNRFDGHAFFVGPTMMWKIADKVALNATIAPQIAGRNIATPGQRLDLDGYTRMMTRVKLAVEF